MTRLVVSTAFLGCDSGAHHAPLFCSGVANLTVSGRAGATINDHIPGINIFPFGHCKITHRPCVPLTLAPWNSTGSVALGGAPALHADGKLRCMEGGVVGVLSPGQHTVSIDAARRAFAINTPRTWTPEDARLVDSLIRNALATFGSVDAAWKALVAARRLPAGWFDSNLAIAADYLRAVWEGRRYGKDIEDIKIDAYMSLKRRGLIGRTGSGPVSPPSSLERRYMHKGAKVGAASREGDGEGLAGRMEDDAKGLWNQAKDGLASILNHGPAEAGDAAESIVVGRAALRGIGEGE